MPEPTLRIRLTADDAASKHIVGLGRVAVGVARDIRTKLGTALKAAGIAAGALAAAGAAVGFALKKAADAEAQAAREADVLAQQFGLTTEKASAYVRAAELSDVQSQELVASFQRLSRAIDGVRTGVDPTSGAFRELGLDAEVLAGSVKSPEDALLAISDRFAQMPDGARKVQLAFGALGDSGKKLIPFLNQGSAAIDDQLQLIKDLGATIDDEAVRSANEYRMQMGLLGLAFEGLRNELGREVIPIITDLAVKFLKFFREVRPQIVTFVRFVPAAISEVVRFVRDTIEQGKIAEIVGQVFNAALAVVKAFGEAIVEVAPSLFMPILNGLASLGGKLAADFAEYVTNPIIRLVNDTAIKIQEGLLGKSIGPFKQRLEDLRESAKRVQDALEGVAAVQLTRDPATGAKLDRARVATAEELLEMLKSIREEQAAIIKQVGGDFTLIDEIDVSRVRAASAELGRAALEGFDEAFEDFSAALDVSLKQAGEGLRDTAPDLVALVERLRAQWVQTRTAVEATNDELSEMPGEVEDATAASKTFFEGFREQLGLIRDDFLNLGRRGAEVANQLVDVFVGGIQDKLFQAIDNGFDNVRQSFRELVADILRGLAKIAAQQAIVGAFGGLLGAIPLAQGGIIPAGVARYPGGGIAREPAYVVGDRADRKPEAVVPLPNGREIPVQIMGDGAGGGVSVNLSVSVSAIDATGMDQALFGRRRTIQNIVEDALARSGAFRERVGGAR